MTTVTKICSKCLQTKKLDEFHKKSTRSPDGKAYWCKQCNRKFHKKWTKERYRTDKTFRKNASEAVTKSIERNPQKVLNSFLLRKYGISLEKFNEIDRKS